MNKLRRAAERLLEALDDGWVQRDDWVAITLRQALEPWDTSDMAYRPNGLSVEQEPVDIHCPSCLHSFSIVPVAKRQWVSLTEEESSDIYNAHHNTYSECITSAHDLVLDVEAKLKEKNT